MIVESGMDSSSEQMGRAAGVGRFAGCAGCRGGSHADRVVVSRGAAAQGHRRAGRCGTADEILTEVRLAQTSVKKRVNNNSKWPNRDHEALD